MSFGIIRNCSVRLLQACGITSLGGLVNQICLTNIPGPFNDQVILEIPYTGIDPDAVVVNNGLNGHTIGGDDPSTVADGTILLTGITSGNSWNISIIGGATGGCNLNATGIVNGSACNPCGITNVVGPLYQCVTESPALNDDFVRVGFNYTGKAEFGTEIDLGGLPWGGESS
ncbi:MAG: hypothetical protein IPL49_17990 [Saprospirales bacterium]|nr:hypothetical protein [Saprospirales bacterium]